MQSSLTRQFRPAYCKLGFWVVFAMLVFASFFGLLLAGAAFAGLPMGADSSDASSADDGPQPEPDGANTAQDGGDGLNTLLGTPGDDTLVGGSGQDLLQGQAGNDQIGGGAGNDQLAGGDGDDWVLGQLGDDLLAGGSGDDQLQGNEGNDTLEGGLGTDTMLGATGNDLLSGNEGDDRLIGGEGADTLLGGAGNDSLEGGFGNDLLDGGSGRDAVFGGAGDDTIVDSDETPDFLNGGTGQDSITPGSGDHIDTGPGADTLFLGQWLENPVTVHGFDAGEDLLVVFYQGTTPPDLQLEPADGRLILLANGAEMASFAADSAIDLQQVALLRAP